MSERPRAGVDTRETTPPRSAVGPLDAFLASPQGDGRFPAVIVAHDRAGRNAHVQRLCERFAGEGYVAIAPDFFRGAMPRPESSNDVTARLTNAGLVSDVKTALSYVRRLPNVRAGCVAIVGFGIGGFVAFLAACRTDVASAVCMYPEGLVTAPAGARLLPVLHMATRASAPILCAFAAEDDRIPAAEVGAVGARLTARSRQNELVVYSGAGHAFFRDDLPAYRPSPAAEAWQRTLAWLTRTMDSDRPDPTKISGEYPFIVSGQALRILRAR